MLISTKGRYALRVMVDMAEHPSDGYVPLKAIAQRQEISEKYLESIIKLLVKAKLLNGLRGKIIFANGFELLEQAAKKRGFLVSRGEYDIERMANTLLGEYHDGKLGRLSLETPDE